MKRLRRLRTKLNKMATTWGVTETEEALKVEVAGICRTYYLQVWNEAFNQARVEASFAFKRAENGYCLPAIRALGSPHSSSP